MPGPAGSPAALARALQVYASAGPCLRDIRGPAAPLQPLAPPVACQRLTWFTRTGGGAGAGGGRGSGSGLRAPTPAVPEPLLPNPRAFRRAADKGGCEQGSMDSEGWEAGRGVLRGPGPCLSSGPRILGSLHPYLGHPDLLVRRLLLRGLLGCLAPWASLPAVFISP